jgi:hypothetical protein
LRVQLATQLGKLLLLFGGALMLLGLAFIALGKMGWQGRLLPGDIVIRRPGFVFVFPIVTSLLLSALLTVLLWIVLQWRR